jgi:hypothetical protein
LIGLVRTRTIREMMAAVARGMGDHRARDRDVPMARDPTARGCAPAVAAVQVAELLLQPRWPSDVGDRGATAADRKAAWAMIWCASFNGLVAPRTGHELRRMTVFVEARSMASTELELGQFFLPPIVRRPRKPLWVDLS